MPAQWEQNWSLTQVCVPWSRQSIPRCSWEQKVIVCDHTSQWNDNVRVLITVLQQTLVMYKPQTPLTIKMCKNRCIHVHVGHELTHFDKKRPKNIDEANKPAYLPVQRSRRGSRLQIDYYNWQLTAERTYTQTLLHISMQCPIRLLSISNSEQVYVHMYLCRFVQFPEGETESWTEGRGTRE